VKNKDGRLNKFQPAVFFVLFFQYVPCSRNTHSAEYQSNMGREHVPDRPIADMPTLEVLSRFMLVVFAWAWHGKQRWHHFF
jgi:hypothetical protein